MAIKSKRYIFRGIQLYFEKDKSTENEKNEIDIISMKLENEFLSCSYEEFQCKCLEAFLILCIQYNRNSFFLLDGEAESKLFTSEILENETLESFYQKLFEKNEFKNDKLDLIQEKYSGLNIIACCAEELFNDSYDICFVMNRSRKVEIRYCVKRLPYAYMYSFAEGFKILMEQILSNPKQDILNIVFVKESTSQKLTELGQNRAKFDFTKPIYEIFTEQAKRTPDKIAYYYVNEKQEEFRISYGELDRKSSILAKRLQDNGTKRNRVIGVYMKRSINYIISLVGIFKAGGVYLPLDLNYPGNYLITISKESKLHIVLTDYAESVSQFEGIPLLDVSHLEGDEDFQHLHTIDYPAILMYTSGSTGKPKGVLHKQIQVINRMNFMWKMYPFQKDDVMAQRTTVNYMPSMWEFFGGLLKGIPTVIFSDRIAKDPDLFLEQIDKYKISYLTFVPSLFRMMSSVGDKFLRLAKGIRYWISCGEAMTLEIYNALSKNLPDAVLINDYGSTEVNGILYYDSLVRTENRKKLPLFSPVNNADIYLFDDNMRQVPFGMPGCIYVAGPVLSLGYIESEELNREKFVLNPLKGHEGERLFKLGDQAIFHKNGKIEVLGRKDAQVKIRGIRMNVNGIESILEQNRKVKRAVVVVKQQSSSNKYLAAYLEKNEKIGDREIREYLAEHIPHYMIPTQIHFISQIPLLPNGKADRKKLESMSEKEVLKLSKKQTNQSIDYQKVIVGLVSDILGLPINEIGTKKKYYELGFDSVSIVELLKQINEKFGTSLTLAALYDNSSIEDLIHNCFEDDSVTVCEDIVVEEQLNESTQEVYTDLDIEQTINQLLCKVTGLKNHQFPRTASWDEVGLDFTEKDELVDRLNETFPIRLTLLQFTSARNMETLEEFIKQMVVGKEETLEESERNNETMETLLPLEKETAAEKSRKVAVIGMSCHYADADTKEKLWELLINGGNAIVEVPKERWNFRRYYSEELQEARINSKLGGFLSDIRMFDYKYFGMSSKEAELMDPQQKICLEETYHAIEDAGYAVSDLDGKEIGVFIGARTSDYQKNLQENRVEAGGFAFMGNDSAIISGRISYLLNLHGPCMTIDTACSSSLTAIHQAMNAILLKDCDTAVAGGTFVMNSEYLFENSAKMGMLSSDGQCKTFDDSANGFVPGEGAGIVILKDYEKAVQDGDRIYGIILASGSNQDGKTNGITAPSAEAQYKLERKVYERAKIDPETISYVETHGTGTKLGDPIEVEALQKAFRYWTDKKEFCALGSLKTNIGHCVTSSGVAGLIKVMLCMQHRELPKNLNFRTCNSMIELKNSPFYLLTERKQWKPKEGVPRRAALSSFGFSGSICHMVLEEYNVNKTTESLNEYLMVLSAHSREALLEKVLNLYKWMSDEQNQEFTLGSVSCTLAAIETYAYRIALVVRDKEEALGYLKAVSDQIDHYMVCTNAQSKDSTISCEALSLLKEDYLNGFHIGSYKKYLQGKGYGIISLPPYPYQKELCYLEHVNNEIPIQQQSQKGLDYHIEDHMLDGQPVLPGAALLDIMCQKQQKNQENRFNTISNVCFLNTSSNPETLDIKVKEFADRTAYSVYANDQQMILATGEIRYENAIEEQLDIEAIKQRCNQVISRTECYDEFSKMGLAYGTSYRLIENIYYNQEETLSALKHVNHPETIWDPSIIDAAFQSIVPLLNQEEEHKHRFAPYAVNQVSVYGDLENTVYVHTKCVSDLQNYSSQRFDLELLDQKGIIVAVIRGFVRKKINEGLSTLQVSVPEYKLAKSKECFSKDGYLLVMGLKETLYQDKQLDHAFSGRVIHQVLERDRVYDYKNLFTKFSKERKDINHILYLGAFRASREQSSNILYSLTTLVQGITNRKNGKRIEITCVFDGSRSDSSFYVALEGFALSVHREHPDILLRTVNLLNCIEGSEEFYSSISKEVLSDSAEFAVIYENGVRKVKEYHTYRPDEILHHSPIKEGGIYLITGGLGGIGTGLAKYLLSVHNVQIILLGRSSVTPEQIEECFETQKKPVYYQTDLGKESSIRKTLTEITNRYGRIDGIYHCAGNTRDCLLKNKQKEDMKVVLSPKVNGMVSLETYLEEHPSCYLVCFSSIAAVIGNVGQTDYAYANRFMDSEAQKQQNNRIYSYDWALWMNGSMGNSTYIRNKMKEDFGILPIEDKEGFDMLFSLLECGIKNAVITKGAPLDRLLPRLSAQMEDEKTDRKEEDSKAPQTSIQAISYIEELEDIAKEYFNNEHLEKTTCFEDGDLDSISLMEFSSAVSDRFHLRISVASLFEYNTLERLAQYICEEKGDKQSAPNTVEESKEYDMFERISTVGLEEINIEKEKETVVQSKASEHDVAVVGISARFPGAKDIEAFWNNLMENKESIIETPKERWDIEQFDGKDQDYVRYGGFIDNVKEFDSLYFHISPAEAKLIDPQQRILLEETVNCLENAGIRAKDIEGKMISVYIGAFSSDYMQLINRSELSLDPNAIAGNDHAMMANRISYFFNLKGNSEAVDTACSSSLACALKAVKEIRAGECEGAIVGGVNLMLDPAGSIRVGRLGFLNQDGVIKSFTDDADGYVRGEGVGVMYLKPLRKAKEDGNRILAIIKGGAANHSGKGHYLMEPNTLQEAEVIKSAYKDAKVSFGTVNYIEAHGTGTKTGDENELYAYKKAFRDMEKETGQSFTKKFCGIGTVKPNIGHLEAASGMASMIKLILALYNKQIPGMLLHGKATLEFELDKSYFYLQEKNTPWEMLTTTDGKPIPRRGEVHAYGYGGTNVHLIMEEYIDEPYIEEAEPMPTTMIFPVSANSENSLYTYVGKYQSLVEHLEQTQMKELAYSMQSTKEVFERRVAFVAKDKEQLLNLMKSYMEGTSSSQIKTANSHEIKNFVKEVFGNENIDSLLAILKDNGNDMGIASLWANGLDIEWKRLFNYNHSPKLMLPSYPFDKKEYWLTEDSQNRKEDFPQQSKKILKDTESIIMLKQMLSQCLEIPAEQIGNSRKLDDMGFNSIMLAKFKFQLEEYYGISFRTVELASKETVLELSEYINKELN